VEWHAFFLDGKHLVWLDNHAWLSLYSEFSAIQEVNGKVDTTKRVHKTDFLFHQQVSTSSLEGIVLLLLNYEDNVTRFPIRMLIRLTVEDELLAIGRTLVNIQLKNFLLLFEFRCLILIFRL
jgi:hypothetical protein